MKKQIVHSLEIINGQENARKKVISQSFISFSNNIKNFGNYISLEPNLENNNYNKMQMPDFLEFSLRGLPIQWINQEITEKNFDSVLSDIEMRQRIDYDNKYIFSYNNVE